mgnify:CR=1 FL=1
MSEMRTPTWTDTTPAYIDMLLDTRHSKEAKDMAITEIMRMARALDAYNGDAGKWDMEKLNEANERMRECLEGWLQTAEGNNWDQSVVSIKIALGDEVETDEWGNYIGID